MGSFKQVAQNPTSVGGFAQCPPCFEFASSQTSGFKAGSGTHLVEFWVATGSHIYQYT